VVFGNNLADYVDQGGRVILGEWCRQGNQSNYLMGRIMDDPAYCPVLHCFTNFCSGWYAGDGTMCPTHGPAGELTYLEAYYLEITTELAPGAICDGSFGVGCVSVWNALANVWYSPGNTAGSWGSPHDWPILTANEILCYPDQGTAACCNLATGECLDAMPLAECLAAGPPWHASLLSCAELVPDCGDPGACCDPLSIDFHKYDDVSSCPRGSGTAYWPPCTGDQACREAARIESS
jgi:hypothetical protein